MDIVSGSQLHALSIQTLKIFFVKLIRTEVAPDNII